MLASGIILNIKKKKGKEKEGEQQHSNEGNYKATTPFYAIVNAGASMVFLENTYKWQGFTDHNKSTDKKYNLIP